MAGATKSAVRLNVTRFPHIIRSISTRSLELVLLVLDLNREGSVLRGATRTLSHPVLTLRTLVRHLHRQLFHL